MSRVTDRLRFIEPQLLTLVDQPSKKAQSGFREVKHDGYRTLLLLDCGQARGFKVPDANQQLLAYVMLL